MSEDIRTISDEMQSIAFNLYEARTRRLQNGDDTDVITLLQDAHDWLVTFSATMDKFAGPSVPIEEPTFSLAERLDGLMKGHQLSISQVTHDTGISRTTLSNLLKNRTRRPHARTLRKLEEYFGVEEGYLGE